MTCATVTAKEMFSAHSNEEFSVVYEFLNKCPDFPTMSICFVLERDCSVCVSVKKTNSNQKLQAQRQQQKLYFPLSSFDKNLSPLEWFPLGLTPPFDLSF